MNHYRLLTELPPRPLAPAPPMVGLAGLWARCREELPESHRAAMEVWMALDEPPSEPGDEPGREVAVVEARASLIEARALAEAAECELLCAWMEHEQALREALASARAAALGHDWPPPTPDIAAAAAALAPAVSAAMGEDDPCARQRAVDALRLRRLDDLVVDELSTDALCARVLAAMVVERWVEPDPPMRDETLLLLDPEPEPKQEERT